MDKYYLNEDEYDENIPSITTYIDESKPFPSVVDRYFTRFYCKRTSENGDNEDHLILFHTNGVCLVSIAKSHIAFKKGIESINYDIGNCDRSQNQVKGKHKKGAMNLQKNTTIAIIKTVDGTEYKVFSCVGGKLLEVNERLHDDMKKLEHEGHGYIAVVLPKISNIGKEKESLVNETEYVPS
ncbi:protein Abitram [Chironomus tepperi]|uniref:protein Abitram n=1 Tax=Chironomus tepperi TaxID=113505 RepID=UPI00391FC135